MKLAILLILSGTAFGQVRYDSRVVTVASNVPVGANAPVLAIPNALVTICVDGNCITKAAVFSDAGLSVPAANPQTTNGQGGFGFWASPGTYFKKVVLPSGALVGIYPITLGGSGGGGGGLTSFTVSNLAPIFTAALGASPLTSPALTFTLSSTSQNFFLAGPTSGAGVPTYRAIVPGDIPTLNQSTTGNSATSTLAANSSAVGGVALSGLCQTGGTGCPSSGTGISGQTAGYAVEAATATTATGPFPLDDAVTTAATITAHKKFAVVSGGTDPSQWSFVQTGNAPTVVTSAFTLAAPTAVTTPSTVVGFAAPCSGVWTLTNTSGVMASTCTTPSGTGTVTSASVVTANGVSGTVATATTTPAITLTLGAITPTSTNGVSAATMAFNDATSSIQAQLNAKAPLASPALTGTPTAPTATLGTNTTQLATTAFVLANASGSGNTTSTSLTTNSIPKANGANSIVNSSISDNGTTVSTTESLSVGASVATTPDGVHPAYISLVGNTTNPSINANTFGFLGPATTTFTAYAIQFPGTGPAAASLPCLSALSSSVSTVSYCAAPTGTIVGTTDTQTLTNKSIVATQLTGTLQAAQEPAHTGDATNTAGSLALTIAANAVTGAKMANNTVTATQLAAQYSKGSCTEVWGGSGTSFALTSGDDAISNNTCYNDSGVTRTITAVRCRSTIASNTTTVNPTFGSAGTGTTILSGALTCGSSLAYSSSGTVTGASWTTGTGITPAMGGTLTGTSIAMIVEFTY